MKYLVAVLIMSVLAAADTTAAPPMCSDPKEIGCKTLEESQRDDADCWKSAKYVAQLDIMLSSCPDYWVTDAGAKEYKAKRDRGMAACRSPAEWRAQILSWISFSTPSDPSKDVNCRALVVMQNNEALNQGLIFAAPLKQK